MKPIRNRVIPIALSIAFGSVGGARSTQRSAKDQNVSGAHSSSRLMADGKEWSTTNLNANASPSYCYDNAETNCRRYGRLYTRTRRSGCASRSDTVGAYRRMANGGSWRSAMAA
jgi:hypothetical protein